MYNSNNTAATVSDAYGGSASDGATNNGGDNARPEFQCDCVCSCCCQCYEVTPSAEIIPVAALNNNNNATDNTHKINSQDLVVHRLRRRRRKRRAKSGYFEPLLSSSENPLRASSLLINGSHLNRRNSAYCICKLQIKFVW